MTPQEFFAAVRYFGEPAIPAGVEPGVILSAYITGLERYPGEVLALACDRMLKTRRHRNFPLPEECTRYCRDAQDEIALKRQREVGGVGRAQGKRTGDPWPDRRIRAADRMMNSEIGRLAASEGWIVHLHDWCRENGRLPDAFEGEKVRSAGLAIKAEREELARRGGATSRIVKACADAIAKKRSALAAIAFGKEAA